MSRVAGALLAAGSSTRLGRPKAFLELDGRTLLRRAAEALAAAAAPALVVAPPDAAPFARELEGLGVRLVVNGEPSRGVGSSIAAAVRALAQLAPDASALLVLHVDQPRVDAALLARLVATAAAAGAAASPCVACRDAAGAIGPPSLLPRDLFAELAALTGDRGARALLERERGRLLLVDAPEAFVDIDTAADYERLLADPARSSA